jgi:hypothetical protein
VNPEKREVEIPFVEFVCQISNPQVADIQRICEKEKIKIKKIRKKKRQETEFLINIFL